MIDIQNIPAPLGLGFEMPDDQEVWVLQDHEGFICSLEPDHMYEAFLSENEALAAKAAKAVRFLISRFSPSKWTISELRARPGRFNTVVGVVLLDCQLREIGRRYWA